MDKGGVPMDDKFLTPAEIAEKLKVNERTVTRWLNSNELKGTKVGRLWRVREEDFESFLRAGATSK